MYPKPLNPVAQRLLGAAVGELGVAIGPETPTVFRPRRTSIATSVDSGDGVVGVSQPGPCLLDGEYPA